MENNLQNENKEIAVEVGEIKKEKSNFLPILLIVILVIVLLFGGIFYALMQPFGKEFLGKIQNKMGMEVTQDTKEVNLSEVKRLQDALQKKEQELIKLSKSVGGLSETMEQIKKDKKAITNNLGYSIKPKEAVITSCYSMQNGKWKIPQSCLLSIATKVNAELQNDKRVVAFEIQGIVDNKPYAGLSPELKQEGLASFRAWEAIREIEKKLPNVTAFEGPSLQLPNKRGYTIKAYFVE